MKKNISILLYLLSFLYLLPFSVFAGSAILSWEANSESDLNEYRLYYGTSTRSYGPPVTVGKVTNYTLTGLNEGRTYYFAVTAVDTSGNESGYSNEITKEIAPPAPPQVDPPPVDPPPTNSPNYISNLTLSTGSIFELKQGLESGTPCYLGRTYSYKEVPDKFSEALFIKTFFDDRKQETASYMSFDANQNITVYVAYDTRVSPPQWLDSFTNTGEKLKVTSAVSHTLFSKKFNSGSRVVLGGADASWAQMYTVLITADTGGGPVPPPIEPPPTNSSSSLSNIAVSTGTPFDLVQGLKNGTPCYVDRTYTYKEVPDNFSEALFIKTFFDDRKQETASYMSFDANQNITVYVAYDTRVSPPKWLDSFTNTGEKLKVTSSVSHTLFSKKFNSGSRVLLGGADASWAQMYTVIIFTNN